MANFGDYSGDLRLLIWRPGDTVQNLESPGLSGRAGSAAKHRICVLGFDTN